MPEMCVWVLAGSPVGSVRAAVERLPKPDKIITANGGSALAAQLGLVPDLVIGDLDSADPVLIDKWEACGVEIRRYGHTTKNETDTELAVMAAIEWLHGQDGTIYLFGGIGGRLDHTLANVLLLTHPLLMEVDLRLLDGREELFLAKPGRWTHVAAVQGDLISLLPVGDDVTGITLEGFVYPLSHETLLRGRGRGVSNEIANPDARLRFDGGQLLVVLSHLAD
ncbi:MAG TPA: thiamine diphosphokinase [Chloroflexia bacterium]|nr:thiamine diphosphokinase [Chloroflexia bacterium]